MRRFTAKAMTAEELVGLNTFAVVLAQNPDGSGMRLELQRALSFEAADHDLDMDTYCLCTESGATHYGGVRSWRLSDHLLEILIDDEAAAELGVEEGFAVSLEIPGDKLESLRNDIERVLAA